MKRLTIISLITLIATMGFGTRAQHNLVAKAKKAIDGLTLTVDSYTSAFNTLSPALTNDETRNRAETWALASRIKLEQYDKYMDNIKVGRKSIPRLWAMR